MPLDRPIRSARARLLGGLVLSALVLAGAAGCNRLTFIKPNLERRGSESTATCRPATTARRATNCARRSSSTQNRPRPTA